MSSRPTGLWDIAHPKILSRLTDGGKIVSLMHWPPFSPTKIPGTHFCYRLSQPQGHSAAGRIWSIEKFTTSLGIEPGDLLPCSMVPQPPTLPCAPATFSILILYVDWSVLGCDTMWSGRQIPFWMNIVSCFGVQSASSSEIFQSTSKTIRSHNLEDNNLTTYHHQNLKTHTITLYINHKTSVHMKLLAFPSLWVTLRYSQ
jgi:hypothetical protein